MQAKNLKDFGSSRPDNTTPPILNPPLNIESVNLQNPVELREFWDQVSAAGIELVRQQTAELQARGLMDAEGNLLTTALPPDMLPGSERDFGG